MPVRTHKAWRLHAIGDLRLDDIETPEPAPGGVIVRIEGAAVLSYTNKVLDGSLLYTLPPKPFVPGSNAVGFVESAGSNVVHLRPGMRVFLSPHLTADERAGDPAQILIGLTAMGTARADGVPAEAEILQQLWRDGTVRRKDALARGCRYTDCGIGQRPGGAGHRARKAHSSFRRAAAGALAGWRCRDRQRRHRLFRLRWRSRGPGDGCGARHSCGS